MVEGKRDPIFYISCKQADLKIAAVMRDFIATRSNNEIEIIQPRGASSADGVRLGKVLSDEIKQALWAAGVMLLIYTTADQDWSWCMWECGVATKPGSQETRIVVLQCGAEVPEVFADHVRVDARDRQSVLRFVSDFLTQPNFFPDWGRALAPKLNTDQVRAAATDLYEKLQAVLPKREAAEWLSQPTICLEVKADTADEALAAVKQAAGFEQSVFVGAMDPRALNVFGLVRFEPGLSFATLIERWGELSAKSASEWTEDIREQVVRAAAREIPLPRWTQLQEARGAACYAPVLTRVCQLPARGVLQLFISLVPLDPGKTGSASSAACQQEFAAAFGRIEGYAPSLTPFLTPVARRHFHGWSEYVRRLVSTGVEMGGPERLEITKLLVEATKQYVVVEPMVSDPKEMHSRDWIAYYQTLRGREDVKKVWVLCATMDAVRGRFAAVEQSWKFRRDLGFDTFYCSPDDLVAATGAAMPEHQVIEDFGAYCKLLALPEGAYTGGQRPNTLVTTIRAATPEERGMLSSMMQCCVPMDAEWLAHVQQPPG